MLSRWLDERLPFYKASLAQDDDKLLTVYIGNAWNLLMIFMSCHVHELMEIYHGGLLHLKVSQP